MSRKMEKFSKFIKNRKIKRPLNLPSIPRHIKTTLDQGTYLLEKISAQDIDNYQKLQEKLRSYYWDEFHFYSSERSKRSNQIKDALRKHTKEIIFNDYYRCVTAEYNDAPLSSIGSRLSSIGGRFNYGTGNNALGAFSALYIAENLGTAKAEHYQLDNRNPDKISLKDFYGKSTSDFRVEGRIGLCLDLTEKENLKPFLKVIQKIEAPDALIEKAVLCGLVGNLNPVKKMSELEETLLTPSWRSSIVQFDIPSNSQSFGHLVKLAGIEAIKYKSKYSMGKCMAIFPENLIDGSFIGLMDKVPVGVTTQLNNNNYQFLI